MIHLPCNFFGKADWIVAWEKSVSSSPGRWVCEANGEWIAFGFLQSPCSQSLSILHVMVFSFPRFSPSQHVKNKWGAAVPSRFAHSRRTSRQRSNHYLSLRRRIRKCVDRKIICNVIVARISFCGHWTASVGWCLKVFPDASWDKRNSREKSFCQSIWPSSNPSNGSNNERRRAKSYPKALEAKPLHHFIKIS